MDGMESESAAVVVYIKLQYTLPLFYISLCIVRVRPTLLAMQQLLQKKLDVRR